LSDTLRNKIKKARKIYVCDWCENIIKIGDQYQYLYGGKEIFGKMTVLRYCIDCYKPPDKI